MEETATFFFQKMAKGYENCGAVAESVFEWFLLELSGPDRSFVAEPFDVWDGTIQNVGHQCTGCFR